MAQQMRGEEGAGVLIGLRIRPLGMGTYKVKGELLEIWMGPEARPKQVGRSWQSVIYIYIYSQVRAEDA